MTAQTGMNRRRGEPLAALALLMVGWTGARMLLWHSPFPSPPTAVPPAFAELVQARVTVGGQQLMGSSVPDGALRASSPPAAAEALPAARATAASLAGSEWPRGAVQLRDEVASRPNPLPGASDARSGGFLVEPLVALPRQDPGRWHLAGWAAWRSGSGIPLRADGARPASYGGTQVGAAARFDLATGGHRPALHLRTTYAPDRPSQAEMAAGAGLRPLAQIPLRVSAELRATRSQHRTEVRPAVLAVTELAPIRLPLGLTAEGYGQAGWVGGRYATAFADGQARVTREFAAAGPARLHIGAGAWGGAQKFAERLDVGPTIGVDLDAGPVVARLAIDYRLQVAGNASPGDGVALTLSTGF